VSQDYSAMQRLAARRLCLVGWSQGQLTDGDADITFSILDVNTHGFGGGATVASLDAIENALMRFDGTVQGVAALLVTAAANEEAFAQRLGHCFKQEAQDAVAAGQSYGFVKADIMGVETEFLLVTHRFT
jgi:hypothetical protein